jgi:hypothetical protein
MRKRRIVTVGATLLLASASAVLAWALRSRPYAPIQPIAFDHKVHVSDFRLDCQFCHSGVRRSAFAGVPPVDRCLGCHLIVASGAPEVAKIRAYRDRGEPIPWIKVYTLPRFVRFHHAAHVRAGVACQRCHGAVERMARVERRVDLTMGWCLDCHRARQAPLDCLTCHY